MVVGVFTPEVAASFEHLRHAVEDVQDSNVRSTITAVLDGLVLNLENQMLLVFANCAVQEHERAQLLLQGKQDVGLLAYYQESIKALDEFGHAQQPQHQHPSGAQAADAAKAAGDASVAAAASSDAHLRQLAPDHEVTKIILSACHCVTQAIAHNTHAEVGILHLAHKSTGSLKTLCSVPDYTIALRGTTNPSHQGVIGNAYSTGLAIRVDNIDADKRKHMYVHQPNVHSVLAVPILEPIRNAPIGVIELRNKSRGNPWTPMDEAHAVHGALILQYFLHEFGQRVDLIAAQTFNPTQLNLVHPFHPGQLSGELARLPGGRSGSFVKQQLVARIVTADQYPAKPKHTQSLYTVEQLANVSELSEYLDLMDYNIRTNINEIVQAKQREAEHKDTIQKLNIRVKVQEENAQHLQEQLTDAKRVILAQKISAGEATGRGFDGGITHRSALTQRASLTQRSLTKVSTGKESTAGKSSGAAADSGSQPSSPAQLPALVGRTDTLRPSTLHDFLSHATVELEKLKRKALGGADAAQRHRMFLTPQPRLSLPRGGSRK